MAPFLYQTSHSLLDPRNRFSENLRLSSLRAESLDAARGSACIWQKFLESGYHDVLISTPGSERIIESVDRLAYLIATGAGAGLAPIAPGTFGSVEGVAIFVLISAAARMQSEHNGKYWLLLGAINLAVFAVGVWASSRVARLLRTTDPGRVVIDEISGQMISLSPLLFAPTWVSVLLGFILFRAFDIFKPYPIRKLERLPGGWGIMADDVGAGILAAAILIVARLAHFI